MWPTYVDVGRVMLKYHRALAQQTTVNRYKHDTLEGIMLHLGVF